MATGDDAQRKKPPLAKAVGGATGATRVPFAGIGGGAGRGGTAAKTTNPTATATKPSATKPAAFAFNMTKPLPARATLPARAGAKTVGASTSGATGGAVRVPVFGKKPAAASTLNVTAPKKAPFAVSVGAKAAQGKDRATPAFKLQPSAGGPFRGMATKKPVEMKPDTKLSGAQEKRTTPCLVLKPSATSVKGSAPTTFGRVKITSKQESTRGDRITALPATTMMKDSKSPRFQFKSSQPASKTEKPSPAPTANAKKFSVMGTASTTAAPAETRLRVHNPSNNGANTLKKRFLAPMAQIAASPAKKPRMESKLPASSSKNAQELNVVSPERHVRPLAFGVKEPGELVSNESEQTDTRAEPSMTESAVDDSVRCMEPLRTSESLAKHLAFDTNFLMTSSPGVFVTTEEEELASFTVHAPAVRVESEDFLQRIRGLQLFVDDVDHQKHLVCNELLDANALVSECLLDTITDATALGGGVKLLELDELSTTAQQQFDGKDPRVVEVAFPW